MKRFGRLVGVAVPVLAAVAFVGATAAAAYPIELVTKSRKVIEAGGGQVGRRSVSADGRYVVFSSADSRIVVGGPNLDGIRQIYLRDRWNGTTTLVSHAAGSPTTGGSSPSREPVVSADGSRVAFRSQAANLVEGMAPVLQIAPNVFLWERATGLITLVSHAARNSFEASSAGRSRLEIAGNGSRIVYSSRATDLVPGYTPTASPDWQYEQIFAFDVATGLNALVTHSTTPSTGTNQAYWWMVRSVSADGGAVAFESSATNVGNFTTSQGWNVYLWEASTGAIRLVSHRWDSAAAGGGGHPVLSADASAVAYLSGASDLVPGHSGQGYDLYLWNRSTDTATLVSHADTPTSGGNGASWSPSVSSDAAIVAFQSTATNIGPVLPARTGHDNIWVWERASGSISLVSRSGMIDGNGPSVAPLLSEDGRYVHYLSEATDLDGAPPISTDDLPVLYRFDRTSSDLVRIDACIDPLVVPDFWSSPSFAVSADGALVVVSSRAGLPDGSASTWLREEHQAVGLRAEDASCESISVRSDPSDTSDAEPLEWTMNGDGSRIVFVSRAGDLVAGQEERFDPASDDAFLWAAATDSTELLSRRAGMGGSEANGSSRNVVSSEDGDWVAFESDATDLVDGLVDLNGTSDVFLRNRATGEIRLVSHFPGSLTTAGNGASRRPSIDEIGRYVAFDSAATDLGGDVPSSGVSTVYRYDRSDGTLRLVSHRAADPIRAASGFQTNALVAASGRFVAFQSCSSDISPEATGWCLSPEGGLSAVYLWDAAVDNVLLVSRSEDAVISNMASLYGISDYGPAVLMTRFEPNPGIPANQVILYDGSTGILEAVSRGGEPSVPAPGDSPSVCADGEWVAFQSFGDLGPGLSHGAGGLDVYLWNRTTKVTTLVSRGLSPDFGGNGRSGEASISADGNRIVFTSHATDLVHGFADGNGGAADVFLYDRPTGRTIAVSTLASGVTANGASRNPKLSASGDVVVFESLADDFVANDRNGTWDLFRVTIPRPSEASAAGDLRVAKGAGGGAGLELTFTPACGAIDHVVHAGNGPISPTPLFTTSLCGVGTSGTAHVDVGVPGAGGLIYFVVVGRTDLEEGPYGKSSAGLEPPEAPDDGVCRRPRGSGGGCP